MYPSNRLPFLSKRKLLLLVREVTTKIMAMFCSLMLPTSVTKSGRKYAVVHKRSSAAWLRGSS